MYGTMPSGIFSPVYGCVTSSCLRLCHSARIFLRAPLVYQREYEPVGEPRAEFLHEVEREAAAARPVFVQKADRGVEADALKRRLGVVREQRVDEG